MKTVGEKISSLRKERSMTQEKLAATVGVSAQSISKWENNVTMPDILLLPVIAGIFEVTVDELFSIERPSCKSSWPVEETPSAVYRTVIEIMWDWDNEDSQTETEALIKKLNDNPERHTGFISKRAVAYMPTKIWPLSGFPTMRTAFPCWKMRPQQSCWKRWRTLPYAKLLNT